MMTDQEIAEYLGIAKAVDRELLLRRMSKKDRQAIEQMRDMERQVIAHLEGRAPKPPGVILCTRNRRRRSGGRR